jgi:hypothetical protein
MPLMSAALRQPRFTSIALQGRSAGCTRPSTVSHSSHRCTYHAASAGAVRDRRGARNVHGVLSATRTECGGACRRRAQRGCWLACDIGSRGQVEAGKDYRPPIARSRRWTALPIACSPARDRTDAGRSTEPASVCVSKRNTCSLRPSFGNGSAEQAHLPHPLRKVRRCHGHGCLLGLTFQPTNRRPHRRRHHHRRYRHPAHETETSAGRLAGFSDDTLLARMERAGLHLRSGNPMPPDEASPNDNFIVEITPDGRLVDL